MKVYTKGNLPGSWHDAILALDLHAMLLEDSIHPRPYCVAADTAFPSTKEMAGRLRSALKQTDFVTAQLAAMPREQCELAKRLSAAITSVRQTAEWGNRGLKGPFARLYMPQDEVS